MRLTVTDPGGHSDSLTRQVTVSQPPTSNVTFRAAGSSATNVARPSVTIPASVQTGDTLVLFATTNRNATMTTPAGWTPLGTRLDGTDLESWAFTRTAPAGAGGTSVQVTLDAMSKTSLTVVAYAGAAPVATAASAAEAATTAAHRSPAVPVSGTRFGRGQLLGGQDQRPHRLDAARHRSPAATATRVRAPACSPP